MLLVAQRASARGLCGSASLANGTSSDEPSRVALGGQDARRCRGDPGGRVTKRGKNLASGDFFAGFAKVF